LIFGKFNNDWMKAAGESRKTGAEEVSHMVCQPVGNLSGKRAAAGQYSEKLIYQHRRSKFARLFYEILRGN